MTGDNGGLRRCGDRCPRQPVRSKRHKKENNSDASLRTHSLEFHLYEEGVTVNLIALLVTLPDFAVIVVVEVVLTVCAVANPALSMVAVEVFEDVHVTASVKFTVFPFWRTPVAVNCAV